MGRKRRRNTEARRSQKDNTEHKMLDQINLKDCSGGLNYRRQILKGQDFTGQNLCKANFYYANLLNANFTNANTEGALFYGALTSKTIHNKKACQGLKRRGKILKKEKTGKQGKSSKSFVLMDWKIKDQNGQEVDLTYDNLAGKDLSNWNFTGCDLVGADLSGAKLDAVNWSEADFRMAKGVNLPLGESRGRRGR